MRTVFRGERQGTAWKSLEIMRCAGFIASHSNNNAGVGWGPEAILLFVSQPCLCRLSRRTCLSRKAFGPQSRG
jgi:hypothetical protein